MLESTSFGGGRINASNNDYEINYFITDHLGSIRVIVGENRGIKEQNDYYPFGLKHENSGLINSGGRWGYNGKEKQSMTGLNLLDYGNRMYDPDIARWLVQDMMQEKFYNWSSYNYCFNNPAKFVDPDGRVPIIIPIILGYFLVAKGLESSTGNNNIRQAGYAMQHPINAIRNGTGKEGGSSLSSAATNFAINIKNEARLTAGDGSQQNAIRHTLWQAILTNEMGADHAERIGNAHEDNVNIGLNQRTFENLAEADKAVDLLNNEIGRGIGAQNEGASNRRLAGEVVLEFHKNGLWTATENKDGASIEKTKITQEEYAKAMRAIYMTGEVGMINNK
jgi:RHS repeat-associated protein